MRYTGSPLGLIDESQIKGYDSGNYKSMFSSKSTMREEYLDRNILTSTPHTNDIYDISTNNIINKLNPYQHLRLSMADFAYLRDYGRFPNNRLVIARRFSSPVDSDLYSVGMSETLGTPLSTIIGYYGEDQDFMNLNFSENWGEADVSFTEILNDLGKDFGFELGKGLGSVVEGGINSIPLPGASLLLQRTIMKRLGIIDDTDDSVIPQGDPNLIKEAKARTLVSENQSGSGLKCKFSVELTTTYEQKFINRVDSSKVYLDVLNNVLNMGTSVSTFYLGKHKDANKRMDNFLKELQADPKRKITEILEGILNALSEQIDKMKDFLIKAKDVAKKEASGFIDKMMGRDNQPSQDEINAEQQRRDEEERNLVVDGMKKAISSATSYVINFIVAKYKIRFLGVISSLTGSSSTPWHVTIGNPLKPMFCSGDMVCEDVSIKFGNQLSFNDLPTYLEVKIKLTSARNLGLQEIFGRLNNGHIRTFNSQYTGEYVAGIVDSYWTKSINIKNEKLEEIKQTQIAQLTDEIENRDNIDLNVTDTLMSKVPEIELNSPMTPSLFSNFEISIDPYASQIIIPSGSNISDNILRNDIINVNDTIKLDAIDIKEIDIPIKDYKKLII